MLGVLLLIAGVHALAALAVHIGAAALALAACLAPLLASGPLGSFLGSLLLRLDGLHKAAAACTL